jgi:hypothetical protein
MLALTALFLFLAVPVVQAQTNYSIDWFTIDGGGGTSTGGIYSVSGTIGQPDAGVTMTGGNYSVAGGFWSLFAVQTPGAPTLQIFLTTTNTAVVEWPGSDLDWKLRWTPSLSGAPVVWTEQAYSTNSTSSWFIQSTPTGNRFYQLHKP